MISLEIQGSQELINQLNSLNIEDALDKWLRISMIGIENNTKKETPVDTWILRNSFETNFPTKLTGVLNNFREYAIYVQEGTKRIEANDFLGRGVEASEEFIEKAFNKQIDLLLDSLR